MIFSQRTQHQWQKKWTHVQLLWLAIRHVVSTRLVNQRDHLAVDKCLVPADYFGVAVAPGPHPAYDDYICAAIQELQLKHVRIDVSHEQQDQQMRLMDALVAKGIRLVVHFVQHPDEAKTIARKSQYQRQWAEFIRYILSRYQAHISLVEIGSTVNRPRWSGYSMESFISAWRIAHPIVKEFKLSIAGPNITDFEPPYTQLFLNKMQRLGLLPDVYSNNLFAERATEPERFDHKVMGWQLAKLLKFNLIKKAITLKNLSLQYGISRFASLASFWTLPRIQRYTIYTELKQADYLVRYMVLSIASGSLEKNFWGPLICHREGLIDDFEEQYPQREKISYYEKVTGQLSKLNRRPSFYAFRHVIQRLSGAEYLGAQSQLPGLEIHRFKQQQQVFDFAWCINGTGYSSYQVYHAEAIQKASIFNLQGEPQALPDFINEQPILLCWQDIQDAYRPIAPSHALSVQLSRYGYVDYFHLQNPQWQAVIAANLRSQAVQLFEFLLAELDKQNADQQWLRQGRNAVWQLPNPINMHVPLVAKRPAKQHVHKRWFDRHKVNKSRAAWDASCQLMRRDIAVAQPIAMIEHVSDTGFKQNLYVCQAVPHHASARELFQALNAGETSFHGLSKTRALQQLAFFVCRMHQRGVYYRDLSAGNLLLQVAQDELHITLIDTNRARFYHHAISMRQRLSDLARIMNKLNGQDRQSFLDYYFNSAQLHQPLFAKLVFYAYDSKVVLKRKLGRKAWRRLFRGWKGE